MKAKVTTGATGCVTGKTESQINLEVALKLQQALQNQGYTVIMCRTSQDVDISNVQRAEIANSNNVSRLFDFIVIQVNHLLLQER